MNGQAPRVGLVEQDADLRELLSGRLQEAGFEIRFEACTGREALALAAQRRPDLLVLDLEMPDIGGLELLVRLQRANPGARTVVLAAAADTRTRAAAVRLGAAAFLPKPDGLAHLPLVLQRVAAASPRRSGRGDRWDDQEQSARTHEAARRLAVEWTRELAHELRGPLTVMSGWASMLPELSRRGDAESVELGVQAIGRQAGRLEALVAAMSADAASETELDLSVRPVDAAALVRSLTEDYAPLCDGHELRVETEDGCEVDADEARLGQALLNLLVNAAKFSWPGTPIDVAVRRGPTGVELEVRDEGPGIPEEARQIVFERGATLGHRSSASGFGLFVSRTIARAHGGDLVVQPSDAGCRMLLTLPASDSPAAPSPDVSRA